MKTRIWRVDPAAPEPDAIAEAAALLRAGELVAFPTETVYGLGADALQPGAVRRIFDAKGRPRDNPLIVHVAQPEQVLPLLGPRAPRETLLRLADRFWPGPLTLVVPRAAHLPDEVTAGLPTVAVRIPSHPVAQALLAAAGRPVAAPSANRSGRPSPTRAEHVQEDLGGRIAGIVDGGPCTVGIESTVLDISGDVPVILRPGGIAVDALQQALGTEVQVDPRAYALGDAASSVDVVRSPGMKYRHYAPRTPLAIVEWPHTSPDELLQAAARQERAAPGVRVGLLLTDEGAVALQERGDVPYPVRRLGSGQRPDEIAATLFHTLRELDDWGVDRVVVEGIRPEGLGLAVMNRLRRAAADDRGLG